MRLLLPYFGQQMMMMIMQGELAATAVNAPMVPPEVLAQLQPFVTLAQGLGRAATQLVGDSGFTDVYISYTTPRSDDLDTRLLRAMVIKGILESVSPGASQRPLHPAMSRLLLRPRAATCLRKGHTWQH